MQNLQPWTGAQDPSQLVCVADAVMSDTKYGGDLSVVTYFFDQRQKWVGWPVDVVEMTTKRLKAEGEGDELPILSLKNALYGREMVPRNGIIVVEPGGN
jgi:hypothetical protein